jgi:hypothetical protein
MSDRSEPADERQQDFKTYAIRLARNRPEGFGSLDRAEKYRVLHAGTDDVRKQLIEWIEAEGLAGEIVELGEPTAFSLLFARSTPEGAKRLRDAPGVVSVITDPELPLDLEHTGEPPRGLHS